MSASADFHAERRTGLGGSDLGAILGLNPYRTPFEVWQEKTERAEPFVGNLQTRFGSYAEAFVAGEYCEQTGRRVQRFNAMLRHPEAPLIAHVDRLVIPEGAKIAAYRGQIRTDRGLECKTASAFAAGCDSEWGEAGTDQVPQSYLVQCALYGAITGCPFWDLAVLIGSQEIRVYSLTRDLELEALLIDEGARWWRNHVVADVPPDPQSEAEARMRWAAHQPGKVIDLDPETADLLRDYAAAKTRAKAIEDEIKAIRDRLIPALSDADAVTFAGATLATYRANKAGTRTDWQAIATDLFTEFDLEEEFRENCINSHTAITPGPRVLRLTKELTQ